MKKLILAFVLLAFIPIRHFGQAPYRQYANDGIVLNFYEIGNPDFRVYLLYNIEIGDLFSIQAEDEYGKFIVNPTEELNEGNFFDAFESFYNNTYADFRLIEKADLDHLVPQWKESVTPLFFTSITMDIALSRAITENNHCVDSDPFCTSDVIQFQAASTSQTAEQLEGTTFDDGCIGSSYNPSWYHMRINVPGKFIIHMEGRDPNTYVERDIDFCMWGPFDDPTSPCVAQLTEDKIIDCSYSGYYSEDIYLGYPENEHHHGQSGQTSHGTVNFHVPEEGEYYILMITNFSRQPCVISFTKTEGEGETDCGILPGIATNSGPYCVGETIQLTVTTQAGASYSWTGPNNFVSSIQNPTIPNCTLEMGGVYTCVTTVDDQTTTGTTEVTVYALPVADFTSDIVCEGNPTQLTSTATTEPSGQEITNYHWDFGDGQTADGQSVTHTFASAGEHHVTHTVATGNGHCSDEITQTVIVAAMPEATASASPSSVQYGGTTTLAVNVTTQGSFTYHWQPENMVTNPNSQTTQTIPIEASQVFTVTITNQQGGCTTTVPVTVSMAGSNLTATASAEPDEICENGSTVLHAYPVAGTGNYTYSWSPSNTLSNPTSQNPVATPSLGATTYTCQVGDGLTVQEVSVTVMVYPNRDTILDRAICANEHYSFFGQSLSTAGTYTHTLQTGHGCDSIIRLNLTVNPLTGSEFTVSEEENCDYYYWDPEGHDFFTNDSFNPQDHIFTVSGEYHRTFTDQLGCDSLVTMNVQFEYTPDPSDIFPKDPNNTAPHWLITATEFQINSYEYHFWDHNNACHWDSVSWAFENDNLEWILEPDPNTHPVGKTVKITVLNHVDDTIWLSGKAYNKCAPEGVERRYWFVCSFYGTDEHMGTPAFNVVPNPNNGQMTLSFDNLTGRLNVKVYDMRGLLLDQFETYNDNTTASMTYDMEGRAEGIYFFVATAKEGTVTKKVVVKR